MALIIGSSATISSAAPSAQDAGAIAADAFVYGYSLITTDVTRIQMSDVDKAVGLQAPVGQFINVPRYPPADYRGVSAPNADTLYSLGWVDVSKPQVFMRTAVRRFDRRYSLGSSAKPGGHLVAPSPAITRASNPARPAFSRQETFLKTYSSRSSNEKSSHLGLFRRAIFATC